MNQRNKHYQMYDLCKKHIHAYVLVETVHGHKIDGIVTDVDDENVYLAIPNTGNQHQDRGYPGFGYGYPGYGYGYPGYWYGPGRFSRLVLPLAALTAISALPWY